MMIKKIYKTTNKKIVKKKAVSYSVTCNKCGTIHENIKTTNYDNKVFKIDENNKVFEIKLSFGYGSPFDSEDWTFYICNKCHEDFIST